MHSVSPGRGEDSGRDCADAEGRLEGEVGDIHDRLILAPQTLVPRVSVGALLAAARRGVQLPREGVGVERGQALALQEITADRTLARVIPAGEHVQNRPRHQYPSPAFTFPPSGTFEQIVDESRELICLAIVRNETGQRRRVSQLAAPRASGCIRPIAAGRFSNGLTGHRQALRWSRRRIRRHRRSTDRDERRPGHGEPARLLRRPPGAAGSPDPTW